MRIYGGNPSNGTLLVQPGLERPNNPAFVALANSPEAHAIVRTVRFTDGIAEVEKDLGDYLLAAGLASRSRISAWFKRLAS